MDEPIEALLQRAYRYSYALTGDVQAAEDLLHDAWTSVLGAGVSLTAPYLYRTIRNRWIDGLRRAGRQQFDPVDADTVPIDAVGPTGEAPEVLRAIGRLRPEEREALFLCAVEGWTATEVADRTGRPRGTVLSLIHRGRIRLRELLGRPEREVAR